MFKWFSVRFNAVRGSLDFCFGTKRHQLATECDLFVRFLNLQENSSHDLCHQNLLWRHLHWVNLNWNSCLNSGKIWLFEGVTAFIFLERSSFSYITWNFIRCSISASFSFVWFHLHQLVVNVPKNDQKFRFW